MTTSSKSIDLEIIEQEQLASAEQLVDSINHSSSVARGLYLGFISFTAFLLIITGTTDDTDLLLRSSVQIPLFGVDVDLEAFYRLSPWVYCIAHINMLMVLVILSKKLLVFHGKLSHQPFETRELLRARLHVFAPVQYLSRQHNGVLKFTLWTIWRVMLVWVPPATILWLQIDSLAMQEESLVWFQRAALVVDAVFTYALWTLMLQGGARSLAEVRLPGSRRPATKKDKKKKNITVIVLLFMLIISFFGAVVPLGSWEQTIAKTQGKDCDPGDPSVILNYPVDCSNYISAIFFDGFYDRRNYVDISDRSVKEIQDYKYSSNFSDGICNRSHKKWLSLCLFTGSRALDNISDDAKKNIFIDERLDLEKKIQLLNNYADHSFEQRKEYQNWNIGKRLAGVTIRFSNLENLIAPFLFIENVDAQGINLSNSNINGVRIENSNFAGADLSSAGMMDASINQSSLSGANFNFSDLRDAAIHRSYLPLSTFSAAQTQSFQITYANLEASELSGGWGTRDFLIENSILTGAKIQAPRAWISRSSLFGARVELMNQDKITRSDTDKYSGTHSKILKKLTNENMLSGVELTLASLMLGQNNGPLLSLKLDDLKFQTIGVKFTGVELAQVEDNSKLLGSKYSLADQQHESQGCFYPSGKDYSAVAGCVCDALKKEYGDKEYLSKGFGKVSHSGLNPYLLFLLNEKACTLTPHFADQWEKDSDYWKGTGYRSPRAISEAEKKLRRKRGIVKSFYWMVRGNNFKGRCSNMNCFEDDVNQLVNTIDTAAANILETEKVD